MGRQFVQVSIYLNARLIFFTSSVSLLNPDRRRGDISGGSSSKFQNMNGCGVVIAADAVPVYPAAVLRLAKRRVKAFCMMRFVWGLESVIVHSSRGQAPIRLSSSLTADARPLSCCQLPWCERGWCVGRRGLPKVVDKGIEEGLCYFWCGFFARFVKVFDATLVGG